MGWLSRLFGSQPPAGRTLAGAGSPAAPAAATTAAERPPLLCWLFDAPPPAPGLAAHERRALDLIDQLLAQPALPAELLPRAANTVPQLIAMLRQDDLPIPALAERIAKDPIIAAEVLRLAGSAFFRGQGPVQDLTQAVHRLGVEGLQMAISRVVLRPMYQARPGTLTAQVAPRLWEHADVLSRHCALAARDVGGSGFDGYLIGLLHDTGWTVLFHALQRAGQTDLRHFSIDAAAAFEARAHPLFGRAAESWNITPAFSAFAADARRTPLERSSDPMAGALRAAQEPCLAELMPAR
jgi:HD-like signal output (HDOD) protein